MYQIYFILEWHSTCFGRSFRPSSGVQDCTYRYSCLLAVHTDTAVCLLASRQLYLFVKCLLLYVQSRTPDDGQKDYPKHTECHSKMKQIWYAGASGWFYYGNNITMHAPTNVKFARNMYNMSHIRNSVVCWNSGQLPPHHIACWVWCVAEEHITTIFWVTSVINVTH